MGDFIPEKPLADIVCRDGYGGGHVVLHEIKVGENHRDDDWVVSLSIHFPKDSVDETVPGQGRMLTVYLSRAEANDIGVALCQAVNPAYQLGENGEWVKTPAGEVLKKQSLNVSR